MKRIIYSSHTPIKSIIKQLGRIFGYALFIVLFAYTLYGARQATENARTIDCLELNNQALEYRIKQLEQENYALATKIDLLYKLGAIPTVEE
jgi:cell division protein FtsB